MKRHFRHILVPLDGSQLAEAALPEAQALAELSGADVTFLMVLSLHETVVETDAQPVYVEGVWQAKESGAREYLDTVITRHEWREIVVHFAIETGPAAEKIIEYARGHGTDLIVMATHGRSGLKRWVYGSVADKVLRGSDRAVLLVRSHADEGGA